MPLEMGNYFWPMVLPKHNCNFYNGQLLWGIQNTCKWPSTRKGPEDDENIPFNSCTFIYKNNIPLHTKKIQVLN